MSRAKKLSQQFQKPLRNNHRSPPVLLLLLHRLLRSQSLFPSLLVNQPRHPRLRLSQRSLRLLRLSPLLSNKPTAKLPRRLSPSPLSLQRHQHRNRLLPPLLSLPHPPLHQLPRLLRLRPHRHNLPRPLPPHLLLPPQHQLRPQFARRGQTSPPLAATNGATLWRRK